MMSVTISFFLEKQTATVCLFPNKFNILLVSLTFSFLFPNWLTCESFPCTRQLLLLGFRSSAGSPWAIAKQWVILYLFYSLKMSRFNTLSLSSADSQLFAEAAVWAQPQGQEVLPQWEASPAHTWGFREGICPLLVQTTLILDLKTAEGGGMEPSKRHNCTSLPLCSMQF